MKLISIAKSSRLLIFALGLLLFFISERYLSSYSFQLTVRFFGLALSFISAIMPLSFAMNAGKKDKLNEKRVWLLLFSWQIIVVMAVTVYLLYKFVLGDLVYPEDFLGKMLLAMWLLLLALGGFYGLGMELSIFGSDLTKHAEPKRVALSGGNWLTIGMVLVSLVCFNYYSNLKDKSYDWSYFKTTKPSESTIKMISHLDKEMDIAIFYPDSNEVSEFVAEYFNILKEYSNRIKIYNFDKELSPSKAEQYRVSKNGQIIIRYGERRRRIDIGLKLNRARAKLKKLDGEFQKEFMSLTAGKKVAYFTRGHGEMSWLSKKSKVSPFRTMKTAESVFRTQNISLRTFGGVDGSLAKVPDDATMVVIAGPTKPFLQEEIDVLDKYLKRGGKLLVYLDNDVVKKDIVDIKSEERDPLLKMLESIGVRYVSTRLANDKRYVSATRTSVDRWFLYTNIFSSHDSVASMSKHDDRIQVLTYQSGYFVLTESKDDWKNYETIKSLSSSFNDDNRNFKLDKDGEKRFSYIIGTSSVLSVDVPEKNTSKVKVVKKLAKVVAFSDASAMSDFIMRSTGNQLHLFDSIKWLTGETKYSGSLSSEEDVKIRYSREKDIYVFYGSVFFVPVFVLCMGFVFTRKRKFKKVNKHA